MFTREKSYEHVEMISATVKRTKGPTCLSFSVSSDWPGGCTQISLYQVGSRVSKKHRVDLLAKALVCFYVQVNVSARANAAELLILRPVDLKTLYHNFFPCVLMQTRECLNTHLKRKLNVWHAGC